MNQIIIGEVQLQVPLWLPAAVAALNLWLGAAIVWRLNCRGTKSHHQQYAKVYGRMTVLLRALVALAFGCTVVAVASFLGLLPWSDSIQWNYVPQGPGVR